MKRTTKTGIASILGIVLSVLFAAVAILFMIAFETLKGAAAGFVRGVKSARRKARI